MRLSILASGSSGNAVYIESSQTSVLIDVGLSGQEMSYRLNSIGVAPETIGHIIITHEHIDHLSGVGVYARKYKIPVYIHPKALQKSTIRLGRIEDISFFKPDESFKIEDLLFEPFLISHDAVSPVGFCISDNKIKVGLVTDLGVVTKLVVEKLKLSDILIIESNHDEDLLLDGPYPWHLKKRIKGNLGHLSNNQSNELLEKIWHDDIKQIYLAHMSMVNNIPEIAYNSTLHTIHRITNSEKFDDIINLTKQDQPTSLIEV